MALVELVDRPAADDAAEGEKKRRLMGRPNEPRLATRAVHRSKGRAHCPAFSLRASTTPRWQLGCGSMASPMTDTILVTGGAGYVGSHVVVELANAGYAPIVLDNFATARARCCRASRRSPAPRCRASTPTSAMSTRCARAFHDHPIAGVVHCAGLKAVGEAEARPLTYYDVNVGGAFALTEVMGEAGVATLVYSSSATVYGQPERAAGHRGRAARAAERLWAHQARRRGFPARPGAREPQLAHRDPALLQSRRRASVGPDRRGADRPAQQPRAAAVPDRRGRVLGSRDLRRPTGRRPTAPAFATTCTCRTSRRVTSRRCATSRPTQARSRSTSGSAAGDRCSTSSPRSRRACGRRITRTLAPRRPGDVAALLCGPGARREAARLARDARPRRDLRRRVAVAAERREILGSGRKSSSPSA